MNYLDIIIAIPLIWGAYKGFRKGLIIEIASLAALLLGIYCSIHFSGYIAEYLKSSFSINSQYLSIISFIITFIIILILVYTIAYIIEKLIDIVALSLVNKLAGAVFGLIKMAFILSVILVFANLLSLEKSASFENKKKNSFLYNPVKNLSIILIPAIRNININGYISSRHSNN